MTPKQVLELVQGYTDLDLRTPSRDIHNVMYRAVYYQLAYKDLGVGGLNAISREVNRGHATALHSLSNHFLFIERDFPEIYSCYLTIKKQLTCSDIKKMPVSVAINFLIDKLDALSDIVISNNLNTEFNANNI